MSTDRSPNQEELDALRLKIDKKLDGPRADGSKAAASKADLIARINTALERRPSVNLNALISEAFSFLVREHGFEERPTKMVGQFGMTPQKQFSSAEVDVFVWAGGVDNPAFCGIYFENKQTGDRWEFDDLLQMRALELTLPRHVESTAAAKPHLEAYAAALKEHAPEVLRGDFSVFHR
jgi:hypothetical protein